MRCTKQEQLKHFSLFTLIQITALLQEFVEQIQLLRAPAFHDRLVQRVFRAELDRLANDPALEEAMKASASARDYAAVSNPQE